MSDDVHEVLERVSDRASFLAFAKALLADRLDETAKERDAPSSPYGPGANGWENSTIEGFLGSAISWAEDANFGNSQGLEGKGPWYAFAVFLYCGKIYE